MAEKVWGDEKTKFFHELKPERVLDSVEGLGFSITGRILQLNSMENRVYEVELELGQAPGDRDPENYRVLKFYRPGRWSKEQILEEHEFLIELEQAEIPVIAPLKINGSTLFELPEEHIWYCIYKKRGGRAPDEMREDQLKEVGRLLGRIHGVGSVKNTSHRLKLSPSTYGSANLDFMLSSNLVPEHLKGRYESSAREIIELITPMFENIEIQRLHGDCHLGNLLWGPSGAFFLDFDDMVMGPPVQDIWLLVGGCDELSKSKREVFLSSYETMREFDRSTLSLIEPLRALRYIHFSAWIGKRWEDEAFKIAFPYYGSEKYWVEQMHDLREQLELIRSLGSLGSVARGDSTESKTEDDGDLNDEDDGEVNGNC